MEKIKIAFDLDGVIINKPPLVPKSLIERLFRGNSDEKLHYRFPKSRLEQKIRKLSHFYLLRQPIKKNVEIVKELAKNPQYELFIISSRYSFLEKETNILFKKWNLNGIFKEVILNVKNEQPHLFKERILKEIKPLIFVDDDGRLADYLVDKLGGITKIFCYSPSNRECQKAKSIVSIEKILQ